jgi:hypothetical protein
LVDCCGAIALLEHASAASRHAAVRARMLILFFDLIGMLHRESDVVRSFAEQYMLF